MIRKRGCNKMPTHTKLEQFASDHCSLRRYCMMQIVKDRDADTDSVPSTYCNSSPTTPATAPLSNHC